MIGSLKNWSTAEASKNINVPTLLINAEYDEGKDWVSAPFFRNIEKVKWVTLGESSHLPMYEKYADRYRQLIADFVAP